MPVLIALAVLLLLVCLAFSLSIRGRSGHPKLPDLKGWSYAHRGLHGDGVPENSMAAFRAALENGYGAELDIHLLKDGSLAVIHDSALIRTTGMEGEVEDLTAAGLPNYHLEGTSETIPLFRDVLRLYRGQRPLIVELKPHKNNVAPLCEAACKAMEGYVGAWCMESFDPRCVRWLKQNRPDIIRGQLSENWLASPNIPLPTVLKWALTHNRLNFLTRPDFVAYRFSHRNATRTNRRCMKRMVGVSWTIKSQADFDTAVAEGWLPIFEGFRPDPARRS